MISYTPQGPTGAGTSSETIQQELLLSREAQHGLFVFTYLYIFGIPNLAALNMGFPSILHTCICAFSLVSLTKLNPKTLAPILHTCICRREAGASSWRSAYLRAPSCVAVARACPQSD